MLPVTRGLCRFESLKDGTVDLADIALMHDMLALEADYQAIARREEEKNRG
ncbi:DUF6889 family protein [Chitiniphilus eburneus]|uniref:DUF6889 family protein n=1 Tax=Chitiniphilus eburneus TaxID=2571148 RepID=UPI00145CB7DA|nr:hypothetical protein [Chitiniphilus eburneus]